MSLSKPFITGIVINPIRDQWLGVNNSILSGLGGWTNRWFIFSGDTDGFFIRADLGLAGSMITRSDGNTINTFYPGASFGFGYQFDSKFTTQLLFTSSGANQIFQILIGSGY